MYTPTKITLNPLHFPMFVSTMYTMAILWFTCNLMIFPIYYIDWLMNNFILFTSYFLWLSVLFWIVWNILKK